MRARSTIFATFVLTSLAAGRAAAQSDGAATRNFPWEGEITASNVYIRSGAGSNYYPTTKVGPGTRVLVMNEKFGWYEIVPPPGSFSYVDKTLVETSPDGKTATIAQDKVYVRAGSDLEKRKNSTQLVLSRGATLEILGEADGFYKVTPPRDARLFVSAQFVTMVPTRSRAGLLEKFMSGAGATPPRPTMPEAGGQPDRPKEGRIPIDSGVEGQPIKPDVIVPRPIDDKGDTVSDLDPSVVRVDVNRRPPEAPVSPSRTVSASSGNRAAGQNNPTAGAARTADYAGPRRHEAMLQILEGELQAELRRPVMEQNLAALLARYEPIAQQNDEMIPREVAKIRVRQLNDRIALQGMRVALISEGQEIDAFRKRSDQERIEIGRRNQPPVYPESFDMTGELRRSMAFGPDKRRYRLVDPKNGSTLAYVDVPPNVAPNADQWIGQIVGIKAAGKEYSSAARIMILVAADVALLPGQTTSTEDVESSEAVDHLVPPPANPGATAGAMNMKPAATEVKTVVMDGKGPATPANSPRRDLTDDGLVITTAEEAMGLSPTSRPATPPAKSTAPAPMVKAPASTARASAPPVKPASRPVANPDPGLKVEFADGKSATVSKPASDGNNAGGSGNTEVEPLQPLDTSDNH